MARSRAMSEAGPLRVVSTVGLSALAERVLADLDSLVDRMGAAYRSEIDEYGVMTDERMAADILPISRRFVTVFLDCVLADRPLTTIELQAFEQSGRDRLEMGVPLESVMHAYRIAGREVWTTVCQAIRLGEESLLADLGVRWIDVVDRVSSALARAYLAASHERLRDLDARRRELVEAILSATGPSDVAAVSLRFSTVLAGSYVPMIVAGAGAVAGIDAVLAAAPAGTLGGHRGDRVLLLTPHHLDAPAPRPGALVAWGLSAPCGPALLDEVTHVESLLDAALSEGYTEGAFGPDDLLVEQLLLGSERVANALRRRVGDVLTAKDPKGVLTSTMRTYLKSGSVPETARLELVHPNTIGYRLSRVYELTGLDPRVPQDAALLVLGLGLPKGPKIRSPAT